MNIVYILGNGFDKAQGMSTTYPEFYSYLKENVKEGSELLNKMILQISSDILLWSDMEFALGSFTNATSDAEEFDEFYFELSEHLQQYLKNENDKFIPKKEHKSKFIVDFSQIDKYLPPLDKRRFNKLLESKTTNNISVINFNYTNTLEKVFGMKNSTEVVYLGNNTTLKEIIHVHGTLGQSIIIGVDNEAQIKNINFRNNNDIKDCMIKLQSNNIMKQTRHLYCQNLIDKADLIILFGVSLGDTDAQWWERIGMNFVKQKNLFIIQYLYNPEIISPTQMQKRGRLERNQQNFILDRMKISEEHRTPELRDRLFFVINEAIFKLS